MSSPFLMQIIHEAIPALEDVLVIHHLEKPYPAAQMVHTLL